VNGFKFLNGACNPCSPLDNPPNYSCPFSLNTGNGAEVSPIWKLLWYPKGGVPDYTSLSGVGLATGATGSDNFPILKQIKNELNNLDFTRLLRVVVEIKKRLQNSNSIKRANLIKLQKIKNKK
jgi:hypothetical protein